MKPLTDSKLSEFPQATPVPRTLADIIAAVMADPALKPSRRRDFVSSIKRFCRWRHLDPALIAASSRLVVEHFKEVHPTQVGKSAKTIANVRADIQFVLARYVRLEEPARGEELNSAWAVLWDCLPEGERRYRLSRLFGYCSRRDIAPDQVDDTTIEAFTDWLINATTVEHPNKIAAAAVRAWNKAVDDVPGWPGGLLARPGGYVQYTVNWETLPDGLRRDAEAFLARGADPDPFDFDAPLRPWRPATLKGYRFNLRQCVSALRERGHDISRLQGLADLVDVESVKEILRYFLDKNDGKTSGQIAGLASLLASIAENWVKVDADHLKQLKRIKSNLAYAQRGMTAKNRERLRQFDDRDNLITFLSLPQTILARLQRKKPLTVRDALLMQVAVAIEILLMAPFRRYNLMSIELGKHLLHIGRGRDCKTYIVFPGEEVKNEQDLAHPIPRETVEVIAFYVERCLPLLRKHGGTWLFPGDIPGTHKHGDVFSRAFTATIRAETGLVVNLHLMRHLGAKLYLDRNPGAYEVVRRVLGHKRLSTTVNNYTGAEADAAIRHFDDVILGIRNEFRRERDSDD